MLKRTMFPLASLIGKSPEWEMKIPSRPMLRKWRKPIRLPRRLNSIRTIPAVSRKWTLRVLFCPSFFHCTSLVMAYKSRYSRSAIGYSNPTTQSATVLANYCSKLPKRFRVIPSAETKCRYAPMYMPIYRMLRYLVTAHHSDSTLNDYSSSLSVSAMQ